MKNRVSVHKCLKFSLSKKSICLAAAGVLTGGHALCADSMNVSERNFPLAYDVDVLVVGGSSGGVAAAVEAARNGSKVFLMAQRPYLGADICGTYRMWPEREPSSDLAKQVFQSPEILDYKKIPFTYETDVPSAGSHKDSGTMLTDGRTESPEKDMVQYDANVRIIATLPETTHVARVKLDALQKPGDYCTLFVHVYVSSDKKTWEKVGVQKDIEYVGRPITFSIDVDRDARFVKIEAQMAPQVKRMLISEVEILSTAERPLKDGERYPPSPLQVKRTFDQALLDAGVDFLYGCFPTDVLADETGAVKGVVMANRAGRQVIRAKTIIDATPSAMLARLAGVPMRPGSGTQEFEHTIVAAQVKQAGGVSVRQKPTTIYHAGVEHTAFEYHVPLKTGELDMQSYAGAQQQVLDQFWTPGQVGASEFLFFVPDTSIVSAGHYEGSWSASAVPETAFRSSQFPGIYMLNGYADVPRDCAKQLLRPVNYMETGAQVGRMAAASAKKAGSGGVLKPLVAAAGAPDSRMLKETLDPVRPGLPAKERVKVGATRYPVLGRYDVVVVGGGTSGAPAAIGAARRGAKTLVIEYQHGFGGVGTLGMIGRYWHGYVKGFTREVDDGVRSLRTKGAEAISGWEIEDKMEWYRRELRKAGADMWMCSMAWGAIVKDGNVQGVAVSTPFGPGIVLAETVIDSTGNGDIAIAAGAEYEYLENSRIGIQGVGLPTFELGDHYNNSDFSVAYESDMVDTWQLRVYGKSKYRTGNSYDVSSLVDTRERRRVVGDFYLTVPDQIMHRKYPDTVVQAYSDYDCHGVNYNDYVLLQPNPDPTFSYVPYRCLLPKGVGGILTTGMGISVHHDALPLVRMQADVQNQGYAAGVAAAMAAQKGIGPRDIDVKELQRYLVEIGNLPPDAVVSEDSYPVSMERLEQAVKKAPAEYGTRNGVECSIVLAQGQEALPFICAEYAKASGTNKLFYAHLLAVLKDPSGLDTLIACVSSRKWDKGNRNTSARISEMDRLVISLGLPGDRRATEAVIRKIGELTPSSDFSHFRAVALALDHLRDPAAAPALAALLKTPGMTGYAIHTIEEAQAADQGILNQTGPVIREAFHYQVWTSSVQEISLARALYECGDYEGLGEKILRDYLTDLRGVLAAHASAVLSGKAP